MVATPGLQNILHLTRPPFASFFIGIAFPIMNAFFDEFTAKPLYKLLVIRPMLQAEARQRELDGPIKDISGLKADDNQAVAIEPETETFGAGPPAAAAAPAAPAAVVPAAAPVKEKKIEKI